MKIFIVCFFFVYQLFAVVVTKDKTFEDFITPSKMSTTFSIVKKEKKIIKIQKLFNKIISITKKGKICKGGNYNISPQYIYNTYFYDNVTKKVVDIKGLNPNSYYKQRKRIFVGYTSRISFNCTFKETDKYDNIISQIKRLKLKELSLGTIYWKATQKEIDNSYDKLESIALKYSLEYSKKLNNTFKNSSCETLNINFNPKYTIARPYSNSMLKSASRSSFDSVTTQPIKEDKKISLKVAYEFECK